jgi:hypothetical protein
MSHDAACMAFMKHPSQGLGEEIIGWIEDPRYELHDYATSIFPVLDSKVLDVNVTRALRRHSGIDHSFQSCVEVENRTRNRTQPEMSYENSTQYYHTGVDSTEAYE